MFNGKQMIVLLEWFKSHTYTWMSVQLCNVYIDFAICGCFCFIVFHAFKQKEKRSRHNSFNSYEGDENSPPSNEIIERIEKLSTNNVFNEHRITSKLGIRTNSLYHTIVIMDIIDIVGHLLTTCITLNIILLVIRCTKIVMVQHSSRFLLSSDQKQTKWNTHKSIFNNILTK